MGYGTVDVAHEQRGVRLPRQFLQASHNEHHADDRALGSDAALLPRQGAFPFGAVTQARPDVRVSSCALFL